MDPNSQHQSWSKWSYRVYPEAARRPSFAMVKLLAARYARELFGAASQMRIRYGTDDAGKLCWDFEVLSEGHPVHDPDFVDTIHRLWAAFLKTGFGGGCKITRATAELKAGAREDGRPADQLIILPSLAVNFDSVRM
jgi:hypothetical protein